MKILHSGIVLWILIASSKVTYAQGCSDAGVCTVGGLKPHAPIIAQPPVHSMKFGLYFGKADYDILVYGNYLEYHHQLNEKLGLDVKVTSLAQSGNQIQAIGLSDIFITSGFKLTRQFSLTAGVKLPLTKSDKSSDGLPLPMDYQSSLGTLDFILGLNYQIERLQFTAAYQQPLTQNNNSFLANSYPTNSKLRTFQSTNWFVRSADVLLRVSYLIPITPKLSVIPGLLPIYHLQDDLFTDEFNLEREIDGSTGLTLNGNVFIDYEVNTYHGFQLSMGTPFIARAARPDGLTRKFIMNMEYRFSF